MRNRIKNLANSPVTMGAMLVIEASLLLTAIPMNIYGGWTSLSVAGGIISGTVLFAWLVWGTYVLCTKKLVKELQPRPRFFMEALIYTLALTWVYVTYGSWLNLIPFAALFAWYLYAEFRTAFCQE